MPKSKQPNSWKIRSTLHEYASELTSTPRSEFFCKFTYWKVTKGLWWKHIAAVQSINEVRFMKLIVSHDIFKTWHTRFSRSNLTVCFLILHMNMLCIPHFKWKRKKLIKICTLRTRVRYIRTLISAKNSSFRLPYQRPSSSVDCARELFKGSTGSASLVDYTWKKIFWMGGVDFLWLTS